MRWRFSVFQTAMIAVLVVSAGLLSWRALSLSSSVSVYNESYDANTAIITGLQESIEQLRNPADDGEDMSDLMHSAAMIGTYVANYQTQFPSCFQAGDVEKALTENMEALQEYMMSDSPNGWRSWFLPSGSKQDVLRWQFATTYEFTNDVLPVLWYCYDTAGELVAFTTGVYNASENKFADIKTYATHYGRNTYQPVESDNFNDPDESLDVAHGDIPLGYYFDEYGYLVNEGGVVLEGSEWADEFREDFGDMMGDVAAKREELLAEGGSDIEGEPDIDIEYREGLSMNDEEGGGEE